MAAFFGNKLVLPIGCSCISQLQLQVSKRLMESRPSAYVFDWAGATVEATVRILHRQTPFVNSAADLELVNDRVRCKSMRGVYFWHMKKYFLQIPESKRISSLADYPEAISKFIVQHHYEMAKFKEKVGEVHCLWSNIQPNLKHASEEVGEPWSGHFLTSERYAAIKEACSRLQAGKIAVWFVCRAEDMDDRLARYDDVVVLKAARSPTDFMGKAGLFDPVFERMGICRPPRA
jgi:hypothetical protein